MTKIKTKEDIKTFEDACNLLNYNAAIPDLSAMPDSYKNPMLAHYKLCIIAEAINFIENESKPWVPDWGNGAWDKYYPWFNMGSASGVGFSCSVYGDWDSHSFVGSRLCFLSREAAIYAGEQFEDLYKEYFVIN